MASGAFVSADPARRDGILEPPPRLGLGTAFPAAGESAGILAARRQVGMRMARGIASVRRRVTRGNTH